jgi:DNA-binding response OmpR family regulator
MRETLLIADGDAELCDIYRQFLTARGYEVETSSDGLNCLRKLRQVTPAVLLLDLELRWGGGDGVLDWIREESPTHGIPVILTATAGSPQDS